MSDSPRPDFGCGISKEGFFWDGPYKTRANHHTPIDDLEPEVVANPVTDEARALLRDFLDILGGPRENLAANVAALKNLAGADLRHRMEIAASLGITPQSYQGHLEAVSRRCGIPWRQRLRERKK